jgi:DNA-binding MarR family transcriptional regulator
VTLVAVAQRRSVNGTAARPAENALREFVRIVGLLERVMQPYFARFGISGSQWGLLRTLYRAGQDGQPALRLTDLSERLLIRPPSVTGVVDRLERAGLVVRDSSAADHRAKHVGLTPKGRQLIERILAVHETQVGTVLGGLSHAEQAEFQRLLHQFGQHLERLLTSGYGAQAG